jgi:hypothetical protein
MTIYVINFLVFFNPSNNIYLVRVNVSSDMFKHPFKLRNLMAQHPNMNIKFSSHQKLIILMAHLMPFEDVFILSS